MNYTLADIEHNFDAGTYARGTDYARRGKVTLATVEGDTITGRVSGSAAEQYRQRIVLSTGKRGVRVTGDCSCPMDYNCKHVVAVLLHHLPAQTHSTPESHSTRLPAHLSLWLNDLTNNAGALAQSAPKAVKPPKVSYRLLFVLLNEGNNTPAQLWLCRSRVGVNGAWGAVTPLTDLYTLTERPPSYIGVAEWDALQLFVALRGSGLYGQAHAAPMGKIGTLLLEAGLEYGGLYVAATRTALLAGRILGVQSGPARIGDVGWNPLPEAADAAQLGWQFDDGTPIDMVLATEPPSYLAGTTLGRLLPAANARLTFQQKRALLQGAPAITAGEKVLLARHMLAHGLQAVLPLPHALRELVRADITARPVLRLDSQAEQAGATLRWHDVAIPAFTYDGLAVSADPADKVQRPKDDGIELITRDGAAEAAAHAALATLGFAAPAPGPLSAVAGALVLPSQAAWLQFGLRGQQALRDQGWSIEYGPNYRFDVSLVDDWSADIAETPDSAWFELDLGIVIHGQRVALLPVLVQLIREAPHQFTPAALAAHDDDSHLLARLPDGTGVALPWGRVKPILATLGELYFGDRVGSALRLSALDAARLDQLDMAAQLRWLGGQRLRDTGRKLNRFDGLQAVPAPAGLRAQLRDYQSAGLAWMQFLREYNLAGILADDMGLGKTIQTLAHILKEKEAGRLTTPALVVAPTSLMANWQAEAARFTPDLRVVLLHGKDRQQHFAALDKTDLVLTTYALLPRDEEQLLRQPFHLLILDESQYIKNSRSKAAQTAALLRATHRLCLTGTPLQNHLGELWSQFHFLMPGLLGDEKSFNADYRKPIEQLGDTTRNALLISRIKPFLLRRTKDLVAKELPAKTEIVRLVELAGAQRDLYETVRVAMDKKVRDEIAKKGVARSQIVILEALLKLRQVCCDPRLVKGAAGKKAVAPSAKLADLLELVTTLLDEGRKILVFSQFTSMLALIGAELETRAIAHTLLTGDTQDRGAVVAAFQRGDVPVFLISLKAGGVGLNLTAADTVIHYDPWWNPAAENQATDRAWRIGQDKPVFVYKLIAQGTLEEKIQELQRKKAALADAILADGAAHELHITQDDLKAIFAPSRV